MDESHNYLLDISRYYSCWKDTEEVLINLYKYFADDIDIQMKAFNKYLAYMKIARCFEKGRLKEVHDIIKENKDKNISEINDCLKEQNLYSRDNISQTYIAISKILWFFDKKTIIMDNNCKRALSCTNGYEEYVSKWMKEYEDYEKGLNNFTSESNICKCDDIINQEWFKKRIFDLYLWEKGKN